MYKIGDKVRVIENTAGHHFKIGEIVKIKTIDSNDTNVPYSCSNENEDWWVCEEDIRPIDYTWKEFEKAPIGTKVTFENGILVKGTDPNGIKNNCFVNDNYYRSYYDLRDFKDNVGSKVFGRILKIEEPEYATVYMSEETEEMTMEEVCKALGKQIKIVKEKK